VEAVQFAPEGQPVRPSWEECKAFTGGLVKYDPVEDDDDMSVETYYVFDYLHNTWVKFKRGDFILKGTKGEFYPHDGDLFLLNYQPVDASDIPPMTDCF